MLLTAVLPVLASSAAPAAAAEAEERYRACMTAVASDARRALAEAQAWQKARGGYPATHCAAAAEMALGRYVEAAEALQSLAREGTGGIGKPVLRASLWAQAAHAWLSADRPDQAEAAATEGARLMPRDPALLVLSARARAAQGRTAEAILDLDRAISLDPMLVDAYVFRASAWRQQGDLVRATADLEKALALDAQQPEALLERGIVRRLKGDDAGARADWEKLTQVAPKTPAAESARLNLAKMQEGG